MEMTFEERKHYLYLLLIWLIFAVSGWVLIEPALFDILVLFAFCIAVLSSYLTFHRYVAFPFFLIWLFIIQNIISMYFMGDEILGFYYFSITLYLVIFWTLLVGILSNFYERAINVIISGYTTSVILSAFLGITAYFHLIPYSETFMYLGRIKGLFKDPNVFGPYMIPVVLFSILLYEEASNTKRKVFSVFTFALSTTAIFLSFSRAAWINYTISLCTFFILWVLISKSKQSLLKKINVITVLSLLFSLLIIVLFSSSPITSMFETRFGLQHYDTSRFSTQVNVVSELANNPLGIGPGQSDGISNYSPHSLYVRVLGEYGFIGFFTLLIFLCITLLRSVYLSFKTRATLYIICTAALLGVLVNSLVIDTLHWRHFWVLLAIPWINPREGNLRNNRINKVGVYDGN